MMKFVEQPKQVGYWEFTPKPHHFRVATIYKPNWFHRMMVKLCFGFTWHEGEF